MGLSVTCFAGEVDVNELWEEADCILRKSALAMSVEELADSMHLTLDLQMQTRDVFSHGEARIDYTQCAR